MRGITIALIVIAVAVVGYVVLNASFNKTTGSGSPTLQTTSQPVGNPSEFPILAMS